jgi:hypothetical protein
MVNQNFRFGPLSASYASFARRAEEGTDAMDFAMFPAWWLRAGGLNAQDAARYSRFLRIESLDRHSAVTPGKENWDRTQLARIVRT